MDFLLFLGRLHPLVVHLPIGFLLLAVALEWFGQKNTKLQGAVSFVLLLGALSAFIAIICGLILESQGGYNGKILNLHKWFGIGLWLVATWSWLMKIGQLSSKFYQWSLVGLIALLFVTGHFGGSLTHGTDYLSSAFQSKENTVEQLSFTNISADSVGVYDDLIFPILLKNCVPCHNANKSNGGLRMDSTYLLMKGGDNGAIIIEGSANESEIFNRVTLSTESIKYMPPTGYTPLTFNEIRLLEWWINSGAETNKSVLASNPTGVIKELLEKNYALDFRKKSYAEMVKVAPASNEAIQKIQINGFKASVLAQNNRGLEVGVDSLGMKVTTEQLESLLGVKEQIVYLNLATTNLKDEHLMIITQLPNLTRLRIENNPITDRGVEHLKELKHLESLNIYGTKVTDDCVGNLKEIKTLQKLYVWQTGITDLGISQLSEELKGIEIDNGFSFEE